LFTSRLWGKIHLYEAGMSIITLTTDFGTADGYVGTMKGVILGINPQARLIDISHHVVPQVIRQAAYILWTAVRYFPAGTVHLVVVDPGVGSARRPIAVQTPTAFFVGPDNGVFSLVLSNQQLADSRWQIADHCLSAISYQLSAITVVHLTNPRYWRPEVSHTFHGRDIFAPVAAHLSRGVALAELGEPIDDPVILPVLRPERRGDGSLTGHVLHTDRFGNVITDIPAQLLLEPDRWVVEVAGRRIVGLRPTYAAVEPGGLVALVGSDGLLEIAVREGNAAQVLGVKVGDPVVIRQSRQQI
jgi:S-adenosylmethionine hydrolase